MAQNLYPLSSTNNQYIPLDIITSGGYVAQAFLAASPLATRVTGYDKKNQIVLLRSSEDVIVSFASVAVGAANSNQDFYAFANTPYVLFLHDDYIDLTGTGSAGTAVLNYITKYDTFAIPLQLGEG